MLPKTAEYALRAIAYLVDQSGPASADTLAEHTKVPRRYLTRVMQDLASANLVQSRSGPGGGYELAADPDKLTILDVVNAVSPLERLKSCPLGLKSHTSLCPLHAELDRAYAANEEAFKRVTIKEILDSATSIIPLFESK
ncbi:HTH-type transcriptional regulator CymR [Polystyrenella longa]|uniref:HTH-type transcriptional regulator CymR n=1 Tax=Polystyrenella longa TaxID=2528007 RepID=A0A518CIM6_9PLAN|nr:Rrf2 family transcriptional regulator [Polystyrenella longa]QDU79086.1 HTH-type transcriptional regulator CymR [Polystyrenella longa]